MKKTIHHDVYIGAAVILISALGLIKTLSMAKGPAMFPRIMLVVLVLLMLPVVKGGIKKSQLLNEGTMKKESLISFAQTKMPLISFVIVVIYAALIDFLGFFVSTAIFVAAFMMFYRVNNWKKVLLTIAGLFVFVYLLFVNRLNVPLPTGILF